MDAHAARYINTLMKSHTNIKNCWKGRLRTRIVLLHDNIKFYTVRLTQSMLTTLKFEVMHPVYSLDLSSCHYEVFGSLKKFLESKHFSTGKEVKKVVKEWMLQVGIEFCRDVMYKLPKHWKKFVDSHCDYVEH